MPPTNVSVALWVALVEDDLLITVGCCDCLGAILNCLLSCCAEPKSLPAFDGVDPKFGVDPGGGGSCGGGGGVSDPSASAVVPPNGAVRGYFVKGSILERIVDFGPPVSPIFVEVSQCKCGP